MPGRERNIASSTQGIASDDGSRCTNPLVNLMIRGGEHEDRIDMEMEMNINMDISSHQSNNTEMDDESMYVNAAKTEVGSVLTSNQVPNSPMNRNGIRAHHVVQYSNAGHHAHASGGGGGKHMNILNHSKSIKVGGPRFRGLSRSAFNLLSQDDQTLSELLTVEVATAAGAGAGAGGGENGGVNVNVNANRTAAHEVDDANNLNLSSSPVSIPIPISVPGGVHVPAIASPQVVDIPPQNVESNKSMKMNAKGNGPSFQATAKDAKPARNHARSRPSNSNTDERYIHRIRELEREIKLKEEQLAQNDLKWEQKLKEQTKLLNDKYEARLCDLEETIRTQNQTQTSMEQHSDKSTTSTVASNDKSGTGSECHEVDEDLVNSRMASLTADEIARYSRQLLLSDGWGVKGQQKLLSASILVIGAGGIGSTLLLYLASSGVGNITVVDFDNVDMSNLHRQVIHTNDGVGKNKAISACEAMKRLNPTINCTAVTDMLTFDNAMGLVAEHDCVVDACDNPQTRYLINDACILNKKPLVSGSAMGSEGQLTVYGYKDSACYRCLYPKVNPTEGGKSCSDNGVLGPVPGLIGILQAIEALKLLTGTGTTMHDRLLMYDSLQCSFLSIKKGKRRSNCAVCGPEASISDISDSKNASSSARGPLQCAIPLNSTIPPEMNVSCEEYLQLRRQNVPHIILDVRVPAQYDLCAIKGSINIPLALVEDQIEQIEDLTDNGLKAIYCLCRRGIASIEATKLLSKKNLSSKVYNIKGGLNSWLKDVDPHFPMY